LLIDVISYDVMSNRYRQVFIRPLLHILCQPFDAHCCHMGTAVKYFVTDRVKPSYVILTSGHSDAQL